MYLGSCIGSVDFKTLAEDKQAGVIIALHDYRFMLHGCAGSSAMDAVSTVHSDQRSVNLVDTTTLSIITELCISLSVGQCQTRPAVQFSL